MEISFCPPSNNTKFCTCDSFAGIAWAKFCGGVQVGNGIRVKLSFCRKGIWLEKSWAKYRKISNIKCTLVGKEIVDRSDVVGALPVGAAPTTSSFSTQHLASMDCAKTNAEQSEKHLSFGDLVCLVLEIWRYAPGAYFTYAFSITIQFQFKFISLWFHSWLI